MVQLFACTRWKRLRHSCLCVQPCWSRHCHSASKQSRKSPATDSFWPPLPQTVPRLVHTSYPAAVYRQSSCSSLFKRPHLFTCCVNISFACSTNCLSDALVYVLLKHLVCLQHQCPFRWTAVQGGWAMRAASSPSIPVTVTTGTACSGPRVGKSPILVNNLQAI